MESSVAFCAQSRMIMKPVLQDRWVIRGYGQLVNRFIERSIGVQVRAETHAGFLQVVDQIVFREMRRAVEVHVLHEMREALLVLVFQHRTHFVDQV